METKNLNIQDAYSKQYSDEMTDWRELAGKDKFNNIYSISQNLSFKNILEVGAGEGSILKWMEFNKFSNDLYAVEISDSGIEQIKKRNLQSLKEVKKFDGYHLPYTDKFFDCVICTHVLEHVEHPRTLLREIKRVSKYQIFEIPIDFHLKIDQENKMKQALATGHINIFSPSLFRFLIKSEGYTILKEKHIFFSDVAFKHIFRNRSGLQRTILKIKNFLIKSSKTLTDIKPNAYIVLCEDSGKGLEVL